jgi:hypothetical protein
MFANFPEIKLYENSLALPFYLIGSFRPIVLSEHLW